MFELNLREGSICRAAASAAEADAISEAPGGIPLDVASLGRWSDLFCRLPLPTLFYRPEAAKLGDLRAEQTSWLPSYLATHTSREGARTKKQRLEAC